MCFLLTKRNVIFLANHETDHQYFQSLQIKCPHRFNVFFAEFTFEVTKYMKSHTKSDGLTPLQNPTEVGKSGQFADCNLRPATAMLIWNDVNEQNLEIDCEDWNSRETKMPKEIELETYVGGWNGEYVICPWPYILTRVIKCFKIVNYNDGLQGFLIYVTICYQSHNFS